jgi:hypothetical protein
MVEERKKKVPRTGTRGSLRFDTITTPPALSPKVGPPWPNSLRAWATQRISHMPIHTPGQPWLFLPAACWVREIAPLLVPHRKVQRFCPPREFSREWSYILGMTGLQDVKQRAIERGPGSDNAVLVMLSASLWSIGHFRLPSSLSHAPPIPIHYSRAQSLRSRQLSHRVVVVAFTSSSFTS